MNFENEETQLKIIRVMQKINRPLILNHIAKRCNIAPQLADYHLQKMIKKGLIVSTFNEHEYYMLQPIFYDKNWLTALYIQLTPFLEDMAKENGLSMNQTDQPAEKVVINVFTMFLKRFEEEIEKGIKKSLKNP